MTGQKTWITLAQHADWIFCLVRTDRTGKAQAGISFLLIDMKSPGVEVRPITMLDGGHEVNEVWFEDVKVPVENLVGEENKGWTYAKFLLGHERANIAGIGGSKRELIRLKRIAAEERKHGRPLSEDPLFAARLAQVEIDLMALEITNLRVLSAEAEKRAPGPEASLLKIKGTEIQQALTELMVQAVGPYALPFRIEALADGFGGPPVGPEYAAPLAATYCNMRKASIYGGLERDPEEHHHPDDPGALGAERHALQPHRRAARPLRHGPALPRAGVRLRRAQEDPALPRGVEPGDLGQAGRDGAHGPASSRGAGRDGAGHRGDPPHHGRHGRRRSSSSPTSPPPSSGRRWCAGSGPRPSATRCSPPWPPASASPSRPTARPAPATTSPASPPRRAGVGRGWILDGRKAVVLHAPAADLLLVTARTSGAADAEPASRSSWSRAAHPG